ncbi:MAG: hypothetical protein JRE65_03615 [Deltaproteobacteria bacterium]|nr:hypothetical protein [Deltaproteobacteria bacterium]
MTGKLSHAHNLFAASSLHFQHKSCHAENRTLPGKSLPVTDNIQSETLSTILQESVSKYRLILFINCKSMLFADDDFHDFDTLYWFIGKACDNPGVKGVDLYGGTKHSTATAWVSS